VASSFVAGWRDSTGASRGHEAVLPVVERRNLNEGVSTGFIGNAGAKGCLPRRQRRGWFRLGRQGTTGGQKLSGTAALRGLRRDPRAPLEDRIWMLDPLEDRVRMSAPYCLTLQ
jgi:hypothetical protein